ncbi:MAG TPA: TonB family protein [Bryobacteraceae bacterium]|nr:TonB family protein [Bryobacteraceae bacterium]
MKVILLLMVAVIPAICGEIHDAAARGDVERVRVLLQTDPSLISSLDATGQTPLHSAAGQGRRMVVELLLASKADINAKDNDGRTPFDVATAEGHPLVAQLLRDRGAIAERLPPLVPPVQTSSVNPEYTEEARTANLQGTVSVYMEVGTDGKPSKLRVLHGLGLGLDEKALAAVQQWQFKRAMRAGQSLKMGQSVEIPFTNAGGGNWRVRQAVYSVVRTDKRGLETLEKPVLTHYSAPQTAACPETGGRVTVEFPIAPDGVPGKVTAQLAGDPLAQAVVPAIAQWRFTSGLANGKPREATARVEFECGTPSPVAPSFKGLAIASDVQPKIIFKVDPEYSQEARGAKLAGTVTLQVIVDPSGHPAHIAVIGPLGMGLDENAVEAVEQWRFDPGIRKGLPADVRAVVQVNFRLIL